jgi:hypothetical protein
MNITRKLIMTAGALCMAVGANAANDITNGGTGYIGLTESAGQPRAMQSRTKAFAANSTMSFPSAAGEATTMVNGRPNANPDAPSANSMANPRSELRSMGNSSGAMGAMGAMGAGSPWQHRSWGTPD